MKNLAGDRNCDGVIKEELTIAGIPYIELIGRLDSEVPASIIGYLNGFTFQRAWYYWVVKGYMPLEYANELYLKYRHLNIRVDGFEADTEPIAKSKPKEYMQRCRQWVDKYLNKEISVDELNRVGEEIRKQGEQFVTTYHIDTQEGLLRFAETIKKYSIVSQA